MPQPVRENVNNEIENNDLRVHENDDLTNAYASHDAFFTDIGTKIKQREE